MAPESISGRVFSVAWSSDGKLLATASPYTVSLWDGESGRLVRSLPHGGGIYSLSWSPDSKRLATGGEGDVLVGHRDTDAAHTLRIWDVESGRALMGFGGAPWPVPVVAWSPDGNRLAEVSNDTVTVRDAKTGSELFSLPAERRLYTLAWDPTSKRLATGGDNHRVTIWDTETRKELLTLYVDAYTIRALSWAPDAFLATTDGTVAQIWDVRDFDAERGKAVLTLRGHVNDLSSVAWSHNSVLATGSADHTARIWDVSLNEQLADFIAKRLGVRSDDVHKGIGELMKSARDKVTRNLTPDECTLYLQADPCPPIPTFSLGAHHAGHANNVSTTSSPASAGSLK